MTVDLFGETDTRLQLEPLAAAGDVIGLDATVGLRTTFSAEEVIHLRPSGNAPELHCYTEISTAARAAQINAVGRVGSLHNTARAALKDAEGNFRVRAINRSWRGSGRTIKRALHPSTGSGRTVWNRDHPWIGSGRAIELGVLPSAGPRWQAQDKRLRGARYLFLEQNTEDCVLICAEMTFFSRCPLTTEFGFEGLI